MFFLLNRCFLELKTSNYIHKYLQIAFASDRVANAKKGHAPFFSLVHPISFLLHTPYFCHPHRPTRMLVSTDADARIDRCGCSYRPTRMIFVDVSLCQTFTFVLPNLYFRAAKPLLLRFKTSLFTFYTLFFLQYLPLFSSISSAFLLCVSSGCSP
jgi:hypothetical protein